MTKSEMMLDIANAYGKLKAMMPGLVQDCTKWLRGQGPMPDDSTIRKFKAASAELSKAIDALDKRSKTWAQAKFLVKAKNIFKDQSKLDAARKEAQDFLDRMKAKHLKLQKKLDNVYAVIIHWNSLPREKS